LKSFFDMF